MNENLKKYISEYYLPEDKVVEAGRLGRFGGSPLV